MYRKKSSCRIEPEPPFYSFQKQIDNKGREVATKITKHETHNIT